MKTRLTPPLTSPCRKAREQGNVRLAVLMTGCFLFGLVLGALCFHGPKMHPAAEGSPQPLGASQAPLDVSTAVTKTAAVQAPETGVAKPQSEQAALDEVTRLIPNIESLSLRQGTSILRQAARKRFEDAAKETDDQIRQAEQRVRNAQEGQSESEQAAAIKGLQEVQANQVERLKQIAAQLQAQLKALEGIKRQ